jgi:hypothetical protein
MSVPVVEDKATPVPIRYNLLTRADTFVLYTADYSVLPPTEPTPAGKAKSR